MSASAQGRPNEVGDPPGAWPPPAFSPILTHPTSVGPGNRRLRALTNVLRGQRVLVPSSSSCVPMNLCRRPLLTRFDTRRASAPSRAATVKQPIERWLPARRLSVAAQAGGTPDHRLGGPQAHCRRVEHEGCEIDDSGTSMRASLPPSSTSVTSTRPGLRGHGGLE
jgi:hypothetical protein